MYRVWVHRFLRNDIFILHIDITRDRVPEFIKNFKSLYGDEVSIYVDEVKEVIKC